VDDVYEWGDLTLSEDLLEYSYDPCRYVEELHRYGYGKSLSAGSKDASTKSITTFSETIGVNPDSPNCKIMMLGCGTSRFGEELLQHNFLGPITQVDVSEQLLSGMSEKYSDYVDSGKMEFVDDDATELGAFDDDSFSAVIDKGLVDAVFCTDNKEQIAKIMHSVNRVLTPGGIFVLFSFSRPQYFLEPTLYRPTDQKKIKLWKDVQIRLLDSIIMYRYQKHRNLKKSKKYKQPRY